ncbi:hypothetical protein BC831DRAFT_441257 [Entophlyctis helioformis]|nr:hypothetical protein BC831DRAFT_441257 [Entophlyctis helioformis]
MATGAGPSRSMLSHADGRVSGVQDSDSRPAMPSTDPSTASCTRCLASMPQLPWLPPSWSSWHSANSARSPKSTAHGTQSSRSVDVGVVHAAGIAGTAGIDGGAGDAGDDRDDRDDRDGDAQAACDAVRPVPTDGSDSRWHPTARLRLTATATACRDLPLGGTAGTRTNTCGFSASSDSNARTVLPASLKNAAAPGPSGRYSCSYACRCSLLLAASLSAASTPESRREVSVLPMRGCSMISSPSSSSLPPPSSLPSSSSTPLSQSTLCICRTSKSSVRVPWPSPIGQRRMWPLLLLSEVNGVTRSVPSNAAGHSHTQPHDDSSLAMATSACPDSKTAQMLRMSTLQMRWLRTFSSGSALPAPAPAPGPAAGGGTAEVETAGCGASAASDVVRVLNFRACVMPGQV